ncbi:Peptide-methionine (R)-S-oxide reductase [Psidium guajava]|nr:Peptide-methionine (R)-S-oxide reductase [Psidium guajava]
MESSAVTPKNSLLQILRMNFLVHVVSEGVSSECSQFFLQGEYHGWGHAWIFLVGFLGLETKENFHLQVEL